jgi:hypothetical protein
MNSITKTRNTFIENRNSALQAVRDDLARRTEIACQKAGVYEEFCEYLERSARPDYNFDRYEMIFRAEAFIGVADLGRSFGFENLTSSLTAEVEIWLLKDQQRTLINNYPEFFLRKLIQEDNKGILAGILRSTRLFNDTFSKLHDELEKRFKEDPEVITKIEVRNQLLMLMTLVTKDFCNAIKIHGDLENFTRFIVRFERLRERA